MRSIAVALGSDGAGLRLSYRLAGDLARLRIPSTDRPAPADRLWAHTCFEAFLAATSGSAYREWNFSPSGQYAEYAFSAYRERVAPNAATGAIAEPAIGVRLTADSLQLDAQIALPAARTGVLAIGLSTVVEDAGGGLSYWALRHPSAQADFHDRDGFALSFDLATLHFSI